MDISQIGKKNSPAIKSLAAFSLQRHRSKKLVTPANSIASRILFAAVVIRFFTTRRVSCEAMCVTAFTAAKLPSRSPPAL